MRKPVAAFAAALALCASGGPALAHHGQDFLLLQDAVIPAPLHGSVFLGGDWARFGSRNGYAVEPGFLLGIGPGVALGTTAEFLEGDSGWRYSSVAPYLQVQLTPQHWRVRASLQGGYAFVEEEDPGYALVESLVAVENGSRSSSRRVAAAPSGGEPVEEPEEPRVCGPEYGPDAPPCPVREAAKEPSRKSGKPERPAKPVRQRHAGHAANPQPAAVRRTTATSERNRRTVRRTTKVPRERREYDGIFPEENHFFSRLVVEADLSPRDRFVFNLVCVGPESGSAAWGYAAGLRHAFHHDFAVGVEAIGDFGDANEHEILAGAYWSPVHQMTLKLGAGAGLTDETPDFTVRAGVVWRF